MLTKFRKLFTFLFLFLALGAMSACATRTPLPRVKSSFYIRFKDGDVSKNEVKPDGTREISVGKTPAEKKALQDQWNNLTDHVALPVENYNRLVNRQNL